MADLNNLQLRFLWKSGTGDVTVGGTGANEIKNSDIVFLPDRKQLWSNGYYFGLTPEQAQALTEATANITDITGRVEAVESRVQISTTISKQLVTIANELKAKIDGGNYSGAQGVQGAAITVKDASDNTIQNLTEAVNRVYTLANEAKAAAGVISVGNASGDTSIEIAGSGTGPYTGAITIKTDASKIKTVSNISKNSGKGVDIAAGTSVESALGTINIALIGIQGDLADAATTAGNAIAKSSGTQGVQTGFTDTALVNAAAIINDLESLFTQLQGSSSNWVTGDNAEAKTLGTLRDLIAGLRTDLTNLSNSVGTLSDEDFASIVDAIEKIKAELSDPANANGITSFLDTVKPIIGGSVAEGTNKGKYATASGTNGAAEYAANLGEIITNLEKEIAAAKTAGENAGVTSLNTKTGPVTITGTQGVVVDNSAAGTIGLTATSAATLTAALTTVTNGATAAQGATVQTALNAINEKAATGITNAATAQATANSAEGKADNALTQLKWVVIS